MIGQLRVETGHKFRRIVVAPVNPDTDHQAVVWIHDDVTRHMASVPLRAAGLRALGQHLIRCADHLPDPDENGDPACPPSPAPKKPTSSSWSSRLTSSSPACLSTLWRRLRSSTTG